MIVNSLDFFIFIYFDLFILLIKQVSFFVPKIFVVVSYSNSKKKKKKGANFLKFEKFPILNAYKFNCKHLHKLA